MESFDVLKEYNIPHSMVAAVMTKGEAEKRELWQDTKDPSLIAEKVVGYDALFSTGLTKDYVGKRGFDLFISLRELIQNALDEAESTADGKLSDVKVEQDDLGTWVVDKGHGIKVEGLRLGGTSKECWMRGYYGEGLKLAASFLILNDIPVYIFTKKYVFKFIALPAEASNPGIYVLLGRTKENVDGTKILLHGCEPDEQYLKRFVRFWNKDVSENIIAEEVFASEDCQHDKPSAIFDFPNLLYIRNMFIH